MGGQGLRVLLFDRGHGSPASCPHSYSSSGGCCNWWVALLRKRYSERPEDFQEFAVLLEKRFGSSTRVDRARAKLRDIWQGQGETIRAYSTRFEALLGKLPSFDQDWAKIQFIWGLHTRVAEFVTILGPTDLTHAIRKAEEIEMAKNLASGGQSGQKIVVHG